MIRIWSLAAAEFKLWGYETNQGEASMESVQFTIIELEQGTPEWIEWRHKGIGASDAPIIMGENLWKRSEELLREKRGPARDSNKNEAMSRGIMLEPQARSCYIARTGNDVKPACLQSNQYPWLRASVDGISSNGNVIVEIKCGESVYRHTSQYGCVPDYYYGQLQHILTVSGLASLDFWCYLPGCTELLTPVLRNEEYIKRLVAAERSFWNNVQRRTGLLGWLFGIRGKTPEQSIDLSVNLTFRAEKAKTQEGCSSFSGFIAGIPVRAEVPVESKAKCDKLFRKPNRTSYDNEYLHDNYWVSVYYKGERHGYKGIDDFWTYSARSLPELPLLHEWIYLILGTRKAEIGGEIETVETWEESGNIFTLGRYSSVKIKLFFKPKGFVLSFLIEDALRWRDEASYNTRTGEANFPFYYTNAQCKIIEWAKAVFEEKKVRPKGKS
jgi:putative phage-type endonuclease